MQPGEAKGVLQGGSAGPASAVCPERTTRPSWACEVEPLVSHSVGSLVFLLPWPGTPTTQRGKLRLREGARALLYPDRACRAQAQTQDPISLKLPFFGH